MSRSFLLFWGFLTCWVAMISPLHAQQPPEVGYVYPPGGQAGTTVDVRLGGYDWTPDMQFFLHDRRLKLEVLGPPGRMLFPDPPYWFGPKARNKPFSVPREVRARITIPADMPPGPVGWQAANANGGTSQGEFVVGRLPEVLEKEDREKPQTLPKLPVTLSGRLAKIEEIDRYRFSPQQSGLVTCKLLDHRIGQPFHGVVRIRDSQGRLIADAADTEGDGCTLMWAVQAGEEYRLSLYDLDFRGNRSVVYRLRLRRGPRVVSVIPAAGRRGTNQEVQFVGYGLRSGKRRLESVTRKVAFPDDPQRDSFSYRLKTPHGTAAGFKLFLSDLSESGEPPASTSKPRLGPPAAVTGVLEHTRKPDQYRLAAKKGDLWSIAVEAERIGSPLDPAVSIFNSASKKLAGNDDGPKSTDARVLFKAPSDGTYTVQVNDFSGNSGSPAATYRLCLRTPRPDFEVNVADHVDVTLGTSAKLTVQALRRDNFNGPIALEFVGLPDGVTVPEEITIAKKKTKVKIPIKASAEAPANASLATIRAQAKVNGQTISRQAKTLVTAVMQPRAVVTPLYPDAGRTVHRGITYQAPVVLERLNGFTGDVLLEFASHPDRVRQGIRGSAMVVPAGVQQTTFPLFLPEWVQTDRTSRIILNTITRVPDSQGTMRYLVNKMNRRITMNVEGALLNVTAKVDALQASPGETLAIPVHISRSPKLAKPVRVELVAGEDIAGSLRAAPVIVPPGDSEAVVRISTEEAKRLLGEHRLKVRGIAFAAPDRRAISECHVPVEFVLGAGSQKQTQKESTEHTK